MYLHIIWQPAFHTAVTSRGFSGSGLGLAISKGIIEQHGGHIWVDSEVGRGSTFVFVLPASQGEKRDAVQ
ncbi:MAG: ATP-binding protein [Dehalococcoidia bacterium]